MLLFAQRFGDYLDEDGPHPPELFASVLIDPRSFNMEYLSADVGRAWFQRGLNYFYDRIIMEFGSGARNASGNSDENSCVANPSAALRFSMFDDLATDAVEARKKQLQHELCAFQTNTRPVKFEYEYCYENDAVQSSRTQRRWVQKKDKESDFNLVQFWNSEEMKTTYPLLHKLVQRVLVVRVHSIDAERVRNSMLRGHASSRRPCLLCFQVFSHATLLDKRNYSPEVFSKLMFLKCNKELLRLSVTKPVDETVKSASSFIESGFVSYHLRESVELPNVSDGPCYVDDDDKVFEGEDDLLSV